MVFVQLSGPVIIEEQFLVPLDISLRKECNFESTLSQNVLRKDVLSILITVVDESRDITHVTCIDRPLKTGEVVERIIRT
jgi:hypothetical protein